MIGLLHGKRDNEINGTAVFCLLVFFLSETSTNLKYLFLPQNQRNTFVDEDLCHNISKKQSAEAFLFLMNKHNYIPVEAFSGITSELFAFELLDQQERTVEPFISS